MATKLLPGKGAFLHLNSDILDFFADALDELRDYLMPAESKLSNLNEALDAGQAKEAFANLQNLDGWSLEDDKFGKKLFKILPWQGGAYRITVVLNSKNELKLDIRNWYDPNA